MGNEFCAAGHMENAKISKLELIVRRFSRHEVPRIKFGKRYLLNAAGLRGGLYNARMREDDERDIKQLDPANRLPLRASLNRSIRWSRNVRGNIREAATISIWNSVALVMLCWRAERYSHPEGRLSQRADGPLHFLGNSPYRGPFS